MGMKHQPPINPSVFDSRLAAVERQLTAVAAERQGFTLKLADDPDDEATHSLIASCDAELATHQATKQRLLDGRALAVERNTSGARATLVQGLKDERQRVDQLGEELVQITNDILACLAPLAELTARFDRVSNERAVNAFGIFKMAYPKSGNRWEGQRDHAASRRGALSSAIASALWRSGIGRVGPELNVTVETPPSQIATGKRGNQAKPSPWLDPASDLPSLMREAFDREKHRLTIGLDDALATAESSILGGVRA